MLSEETRNNAPRVKFHRIYHYRPDIEPRDVEALCSSSFWSAKVSYLNDPFEFSALKSAKEHPDVVDSFADSGVTCFCRSITNPLLWSHYAAKHKGFAIGINSAHPHFGGDKGIGKRFLLDVHYEDVAPTYERFADGLPLAAVLTKPTCWAYEQEVRLIRQNGDELFEVPTDMIVEIAFGTHMSESRVSQIISAVEAAGIPVEFTQMELLEEGFGVKPVPVSRA